jgi:hypothetical protein
MPITLTIDTKLVNQGGRVNLAVSFTPPDDETEALINIGIIRPDGTKEYPIYMQRFPLPSSVTQTGAAYITKVQGWHKVFAQVFYYTNGSQIENEITAKQPFFVGPVIGPIIPTPLPTG